MYAGDTEAALHSIRDLKILINDDNDGNSGSSRSRVSGDDKKHRLQIAKSHENGTARAEGETDEELKVKGGRDGRRASSY